MPCLPRGVVLLFNAVTKAQRAQQEAAAGGSKAAKVTKAAFMSQLKAQQGTGGEAGGVAAGGAGEPERTQTQYLTPNGTPDMCPS